MFASELQMATQHALFSLRKPRVSTSHHLGTLHDNSDTTGQFSCMLGPFVLTGFCL
jgi:hypothetical protein